MHTSTLCRGFSSPWKNTDTVAFHRLFIWLDRRLIPLTYRLKNTNLNNPYKFFMNYHFFKYDKMYTNIRDRNNIVFGLLLVTPLSSFGDIFECLLSASISSHGITSWLRSGAMLGISLDANNNNNNNFIFLLLLSMLSVWCHYILLFSGGSFVKALIWQYSCSGGTIAGLALGSWLSKLKAKVCVGWSSLDLTWSVVCPLT